MELSIGASELSDVIRESLLTRFVGQKCPIDKREIVDVQVTLEEKYWDGEFSGINYRDISIEVITESPVRKLKSYYSIDIEDWR